MLLTRRADVVRRVVAVGLVLMAALWLAVGCGGGGSGGSQGEEENQQQAATPVVGEFVGNIPEADIFLALVAEEPQEQGSQEREVRGYLCDGRQLNEWFSGTVMGDEVQLTSPNGVQLETILASAEVATGTITLSDGTRVGFEAPIATNIEGFYPVNITSEGQVSGTSWSDSQLEGSSAERISGTITPPEGEAVDFRVSNPNIEEGEYRWIVLTEDDQPKIKGAKKGANSTGSTGGTRSPSIIVDYIDE